MNWKSWLKGLIAGIVSSVASGIVVVLVDPHTFSDYDKLIKIGIGLGIWGAAMYLKQSPVPPDVVVETTVRRTEPTRPSGDQVTTIVKETRTETAAENKDIGKP